MLIKFNFFVIIKKLKNIIRTKVNTESLLTLLHFKEYDQNRFWRLKDFADGENPHPDKKRYKQPIKKIYNKI